MKEKSLLADENETALQKAIRLLEEILRQMKLNVQCTIDNVEINSQLSIIHCQLSGFDASKCIGQHGKLLDALEVIINAAVPIKIKIDSDNYRRRRVEVLRRLAKSTARQVLVFRKEIKLEAMSRADRKVIHEALQDNPKVETRSVGVEPYRRVVVYPMDNLQFIIENL